MKKNKSSPSTSVQCTVCRRQLEIGSDVLSLVEGVIGPRGLVPLGETTFFCDESCLLDYAADGNEDLMSMPPRVP